MPKIISAKELQRNQASILREVASGTEYVVTFHGRPWVELRSSQPPTALQPGSAAAFQHSLQFISKTKPYTTESDQQLRRRQLSLKYGFEDEG